MATRPNPRRCGHNLEMASTKPIFCVNKCDSHEVFVHPDYQRKYFRKIDLGQNYYTNKTNYECDSKNDFGIHSIIFLRNGRGIIFGSADTSINMLLNNEEFNLRQTVCDENGMPITCMKFLNENLNYCIASSQKGIVFTFSPDKPGFEIVMTETQHTYTLDVSKHSQEFVTGGDDGTIRVYQITPNETRFLNNLNYTPHKGETFSLEHDREKAMLEWYRNQVDIRHQNVTNVRESILDQVHFEQKRRYGDMTLHLRNFIDSHAFRIMALKFQKDDPYLFASAGWDRNVNLWDLRSPHGRILRIHGPLVSSADAMDYQDNFILTGSSKYERALELWDLRYIKKDYNTETLADFTDCYNKCEIVQYPSKIQECPKQIQIKLKTPAEIAEKKEYPEYINCCRFIGRHTIACAGEGGDVRFMSRIPYVCQVSVPIETTINCMDTLNDGQFVCVGCKDGSVHVIKVSG